MLGEIPLIWPTFYAKRCLKRCGWQKMCNLCADPSCQNRFIPTVHWINYAVKLFSWPIKIYPVLVAWIRTRNMQFRPRLTTIPLEFRKITQKFLRSVRHAAQWCFAESSRSRPGSPPRRRGLLPGIQGSVPHTVMHGFLSQTLRNF